MDWERCTRIMAESTLAILTMVKLVAMEPLSFSMARITKESLPKTGLKDMATMCHKTCSILDSSRTMYSMEKAMRRANTIVLMDSTIMVKKIMGL